MGRSATSRFGVLLRAGVMSAAVVGLLPAAPASPAVPLVQQGAKLSGNGPIGTGGQGFGEFGYSVAVSADGNTALVGSPYDAGPFVPVTGGAVYVFTRSGGVWSQQGPKLVNNCTSNCANQGTAGDGGHFGTSVALSNDGNTALIGALTEGSGGSVWVFTRSGGAWTQQGPKLVGNCTSNCAHQGTGQVANVGFGQDVALSGDGDTALIGNESDRSGRGAAWRFTRSGGVWSPQGPKLVGDCKVDCANQGTGGDGGRFGGSVALSDDGNTALVGGWQDGTDGAAWVFTRAAGLWTQQGAKIVGNCEVNCANQGTGESQSGDFGYDVALSADGDTALVGGPDDEPGGSVWVFARSAGAWTQQGPKLEADDESNGSFGGEFGFSVALSADGETALIGGPADHTDVGAAWLFSRSAGVWSQQRDKLVGDCASDCADQGVGAIGRAEFGAAVAMSSEADTALIGGWGDDKNTGAAWVFAPAGTVVPVNAAAPTISGTATAGQVLTEARGAWLNNPSSFHVQWEACDAIGGSCTAIPGATAQAYTLTSSDVGHTIRATETATNAVGTSSPAKSQPTGIVRAGSVITSKPLNTTPPAVSGTPEVGRTLLATPGSWSGSTPISYAYRWQRCAPSCAAVAATGSAYTLTADDAGASMRVVVTASNAAGSALANSAQTAAVRAAGANAALVGRALLAVLVPAGKKARIRALLRLKGFRFAFTAPSAGQLSIRWLTRGTSKPLLVASATVHVTKAGTKTVRIKLTPKGRRLLKRSRRLKLTAKAAFTPTGGSKTSRSAAFILKR